MGNPKIAEPAMGQSVTVYYDSLNPTENGLTPFAERSDEELSFAIAILILGAMVAGGFLVLDAVVSKSTS